jgi:CheY-like chemotaxis protein
VVLMDLSMPLVDGWEATRTLKADEQTRHIPIVALTGHALNGFEEGARRAGCDAVITKPCTPSDLLAHLRAILEAERRAGA